MHKENKFQTLTRYPEQMPENMQKFDLQRVTLFWTKMRDLTSTLIQYLLQQNRSGMLEDERIKKDKDATVHWFVPGYEI